MNRVRAMPVEPVAAMRIRRLPPDPRDPISPDRRSAHVYVLTSHSDRICSRREQAVFALPWLAAEGKAVSVLAMQIMGSIITFVEPAFRRLFTQASDCNQACPARVFPMKTRPGRSPAVSQTIRNATILCHSYFSLTMNSSPGC